MLFKLVVIEISISLKEGWRIIDIDQIWFRSFSPGNLTFDLRKIEDTMWLMFVDV